MIGELVWSFIQIGLFSIGGGYAALPLIYSQVVDVHAWLTASEFADVVAISQMTPGPIAINSASFVGMRIAGIPGALAATFGCILPSIIIVMLLAVLYTRYKKLTIVQGVLDTVRPAAVGLIASAGLSIAALALWGAKSGELLSGELDFTAIGLFACALLVLRKRHVNPILVMAGTGLAGALVYSLI